MAYPSGLVARFGLDVLPEEAEPFKTLPDDYEFVGLEGDEYVRAGSHQAAVNAAVRAEQGRETFNEYLDRTDPDGSLDRERRARQLRFEDAASDGAAGTLAMARGFRQLGMSPGAALAAAQRPGRER